MNEPTPLACLDCGALYNTFPLDTVLSNGQWQKIHDSDGGILCANCIVARAALLPGATVCHLWIEIAPTANEVRLAKLERTAQAVVDLDDGDKPALWHFEAEFAALRTALARDGGGK